MTPVKLTARHDDVDLERDRSLVERCQQGDQRAFEDLYLRYRDRLFRFCLRRTGNASEAEDLVQEAFARAWKALPNFSGERRFYPWLSVIASNLCTDLARKGRRCTPVDESNLDLLAPSVASEQEELVERQREDAILAAALGRISPRHREVLELREGRNWSYQQIASHAGVEVSTIETLLFRARRSLKREYMTLAKAETGLAGVLALPIAALRRAFAGGRHLVGRAGVIGKRLIRPAVGLPSPGAATTAAPVSLGTLVGGVAVAATAAAITFGGLVAARSHPAKTTTYSAPSARSSPPGGPAGSVGRPADRPGLLRGGERAAKTSPSRSSRSPAGAASGAAAAGRVTTAGATSGTSASAALSSGLKSVTSGVKQVTKKVTGTLKKVTSGVSGTVSGVSGTVSGVTSGASGTVSGVTSGVSGTVSGTVSGVTSGVSGTGGSHP